jgi:hypothetical protein
MAVLRAPAAFSALISHRSSLSSSTSTAGVTVKELLDSYAEGRVEFLVTVAGLLKVLVILKTQATNNGAKIWNNS